jgi:preprotein translocase subunit SecE
VSDEGNAADLDAAAARDGGDTEVSPGGGRTAVVTKPAARPQRPTGKRSRQRMLEAIEDEAQGKDAADDAGESEGDKGDSSSTKTKKKPKSDRAKKGPTAKKTKKPKKAGERSANPFLFVYNYLKQVVAEMRKVIWPSRKQMLTYTGVVLAFLAFMVALVGLSDFGLTKLVMLVFG